MKSKLIITAQITACCLIIGLCVHYFYFAPLSSAWFHTEYREVGEYTIGELDFRFYGLDTEQAQIGISTIAPTRYFDVNPDRPANDNLPDANFDMAVTVHKVFAHNLSTIDVNVELTLKDNNTNNDSHYYVLVPIDSSNTNYTTNFSTGKYHDYLDAAFASTGLDMDIKANWKTAMDQLNTAAQTKIKKIKVSKETNNAALCYILIWSEYDNVYEGNASAPVYWGTNASLLQRTYPITLEAYVFQDYMETP